MRWLTWHERLPLHVFAASGTRTTRDRDGAEAERTEQDQAGDVAAAAVR